MHIWLLSGYAGSGKDTIAAMMLEILGSQGQEAVQSSFAGAVKDEVAAMYDLTRESLESQAGKARILHFVDGTSKTVREVLIDHAERIKAKRGLAVWANRLQKPNTDHWILSDWRFRAEYENLRARFPDATLHTVRVVRPSVQPLTTYTEHELADFGYEHIIDNSDSLLYAKKHVERMIDALLTCP